MDRDLAKHVVTVGFHSLSLLERMTDLFKKVFQEYPDLEQEVEAKINKYGKFI